MREIEDFIHFLKPLCSAETAFKSEEYSHQTDNPFLHHCVPVTLAIQKRFGGDIKVVDAINKKNPQDTIGHVYNFIDGHDIDGTAEQLRDNYYFVIQKDFPDGFITRDELLSIPHLKKIYTIFEEKIKAIE